MGVGVLLDNGGEAANGEWQMANGEWRMGDVWRGDVSPVVGVAHPV